MLEYLLDSVGDGVVDLTPLRRSELSAWLEGQPQYVQSWVACANFTADPGSICLVPANGKGKLGRVLCGLSNGEDDVWAYAALPGRLPPGAYRLDRELDGHDATWAALGWMMATYGFSRYKTRGGRDWPCLLWPAKADRAAVRRIVHGAFLVRDLINTPASDMGPEELAVAARDLAGRFNARCRIIVGDELLREGYPAIHAVGRASTRAPRLIDIRWGDESKPKVTLVGKGVCFDSGGLDLKSAANMKMMKKDMGGAAHVLGLALMIMEADLPVRLRVLVPAVENAVAGNAFRPLDVLATRKGLTVEVGNTDAEGRLVLADALAEADREKPDLLIDIATLTGAARTALGTDIPALFTNDDALAADLMRHGEAEADPMWRLPLWKPYRRMLDSKIADINNASDSAYAGAITAALFLQEFTDCRHWVHVDMMAWNMSSRPGRPDGGEAMTLRAFYAAIAERFGQA